MTTKILLFTTVLLFLVFLIFGAMDKNTLAQYALYAFYVSGSLFLALSLGQSVNKLTEAYLQNFESKEFLKKTEDMVK